MTKAQKHMGRVAAIGCLICRNVLNEQSPAEVHHIGDTAIRSDFLTIPLCPLHHRLGGLGVAYHAGPKEFERQFGSELQLLDMTLQALA